MTEAERAMYEELQRKFIEERKQKVEEGDWKLEIYTTNHYCGGVSVIKFDNKHRREVRKYLLLQDMWNLAAMLSMEYDMVEEVREICEMWKAQAEVMRHLGIMTDKYSFRTTWKAADNHSRNGEEFIVHPKISELFDQMDKEAQGE